MAINLKKEELDTIRKILRKHIPHAEYLAFGSRVTGTAKQYSDLDLAIRASEPISLNTLSALEEDFAESSLPFKIDLIDFHRISPEFQQKIQEQGENFL